MSSGDAVGAVRPVGSANGGRSIGSGGAITRWDEFEAWASSVEALEVAEQIDAKLAEAETARHPFARGWAPIEVLVSCIGALASLVPAAMQSLLATASGRAARVLSDGLDSIESRLAARAELERPLRDLAGRIRAAHAEAAELAHLARWARVCGLEIQHSPGCPGAVVPGVALLIDETIPAAERFETIRSLLRDYGRAEAA